MSKTGSSLFSFILGAGVGFAAGILLAPDKGSNTRDKLSYQLDRYRQQLSKIVDELMEEGNSPDSLAKDAGERVIEAAKSKAEALLEDVDDLIHQIRESKEKTTES